MEAESIVVTGANAGIGFAAVKRILSERPQAHVFLGALTQEEADNAVAELQLPDRVTGFQIDLTDVQSINAAAKLIEESGRLPITALINNAGFWSRTDLKKAVDVNLYGTRNFTNALITLMDQEKGRVINMASVAGPNFLSVCNEKTRDFFTNPEARWEDLDQLASAVVKEYSAETKEMSQTLRDMGIFHWIQYFDAFMAPYTFSKACILMLTSVLANEHHNLKVVSCHPGSIMTSITRQINNNDEDKMRKIGLKSPEEGADIILILLEKSFEEIENKEFYGPSGNPEPKIQYPPGVFSYVFKGVYQIRKLANL